MKNIFKFMGEYKRYILIIIVLLIIQAYCDLALPAYTSDILNVGLTQSGIDHVVPRTIRRDNLDNLERLIADEYVEVVERAYGQADASGICTLSKDADIELLKDILIMPECIYYQAKTNGEFGFMLGMASHALDKGELSKEDLLMKVEDVIKTYQGMPDEYMEQIAIKYVSIEYSMQGLSLDKIRNDYLFKVGIKMLVVTLIMSLAAIATGFIASIVSASIGKNLRSRIFSKVVSFSGNEQNSFSTASLITRATNDVQQVQMVVFIFLRLVMYAPVLAIGGIIRVLVTRSGLGWIIAVAVVFLAIIVGVLTGIALPKFKIMQELVDGMNLVAREILTGIMPIRAFSRETYEEARFDEASTRLYRTQLFTNRVMTFMMPLMMFIMNGISVLIVWLGAKKVDMGTIQIGDLTAFITYSMVIVMGFLVVTMVSILMPRAGVAADRIVQVLDTKVSIKDIDEPEKAMDSMKGLIEFKDVSFAYPGASENVLSDISFTAMPGKTTAIIGSTGAGKTSILNLILRFYDVSKGSITVDGVDIRKLSQKKLRESIGYVPQKGMLFSGTIASNIKYASDDITDNMMDKAAAIAQAKDFIDSKGDGYESAIAQEGSNVSGGQRQRLSIARAIAKNPKIYMFDDSFSALDFKTDLALRTALQKEIKDATMIIVAQRISTIMNADQILVLDEGKLVGLGTHSQLLTSCQTYKEIAKSQMSKAELGGAL